MYPSLTIANHWPVLAIAVGMLLLQSSYVIGAGDKSVAFRNDAHWAARFNPQRSTLDLEHTPTRARIAGTLSFIRHGEEGPETWSVVASRDSVEQRLALLDTQGNVQGYASVSGSGDELRIHVAHRSAQNYPGELVFRGVATLGKQTFACRTRAPDTTRVVQMAAGPADSRLNDSLFDIPTDTAVRLGGQRVRIKTQAPLVVTPKFDVEMAATIHDAAHSSLVFDVMRDYYRSRYVPYYTPVDKERCPSPPTGWMSWNVYFDTADEEDNLAEARIGKQYLQPFGMEIWHIESWQDNSDKLPVSKFHNLTLRPNPRQFAHGMKWLADEIRKFGFKPGIWTVPFGTGDSAFYEEHKAWFLHHPDGTPMRNWNGLYVLDPSQEVVRRHMEDTHRVMSKEWGYEYFKIDGMSGRHHSYSAHFYERDEVRAAFKQECEDPFRLCVEALRRGIGADRIWLACQGHYTGPEARYADAGRLGADIVHAPKPPNWHNYLNQARCTLNQLFVNNIVWYGDPDTLLVGQGLPMDMVRLATTVVGLPGQMMFAGDRLGELPPERMRLLQQVLPVCDVRPLDLFPIYEMLPVWDLKVRRPFADWDVVSLFNWDEEAEEFGLAFAELGLRPDREYLVYDFWNQAFRGRHRERYISAVPGSGNVLLAVHPAQHRPQFLSTDRHITQGAVSVEDVSWDGAKKALTCRVRLVGTFPSKLVFFAPEPYELKTLHTDDAEVVSHETLPDRTIVATVRRDETGTAFLHLRF